MGIGDIIVISFCCVILAGGFAIVASECFHEGDTKRGNANRAVAVALAAVPAILSIVHVL